MNPDEVDGPDVLIVGGGPAGLSAARRLRQLGVGRVVVAERERIAGGVPRHCDHSGFGLRDLHKNLGGPRYAAALVSRAESCGARVWAETSVTGVSLDGIVDLTSPAGVFRLRPRALVLATGARERPRHARLIPGDRPRGVFTTGQLQQWVHLHHLPVGQRALVIGAEHVSFSAMLTLRQAGVDTVALVTEQPRHQTLPAFALAGRVLYRVPVWKGTRVVSIVGRSVVEGVELEDLGSGRRRTIDVDTVVFTGDWVPDNELARLQGLEVDPATRGPRTAADGTSSSPGVFAVGNLVHPVETADVAALNAVQAAGAVHGWLERSAGGGSGGGSEALGTPHRSPGHSVPVIASGVLRWVWPNLVFPGAAGPHGGPWGQTLLRTEHFTDERSVVVQQGDHVLGRYRLRRGTPNRSLRIPGDWQGRVQAFAPVVVRLGESR